MVVSGSRQCLVSARRGSRRAGGGAGRLAAVVGGCFALVPHRAGVAARQEAPAAVGVAGQLSADLPHGVAGQIKKRVPDGSPEHRR